METVLDALPGQPLTATDVATLNDSTRLRVIPYTWYGEQVIAVLLLYDERRMSAATEEPVSGEDGSATEQTGSADQVSETASDQSGQASEDKSEAQAAAQTEESVDDQSDEGGPGTDGVEIIDGSLSATPSTADARDESDAANSDDGQDSDSTAKESDSESVANDAEVEDDTQFGESEVIGEASADETAADSDSGFGSRNRKTVGTVEVIGSDSMAAEEMGGTEPDTGSENTSDSDDGTETATGSDATEPDSGDGATDQPDSSTTETESSEPPEKSDDVEELHVYAVGYDDSEAAWVVITEVDPDAEFTDAEPPIRDWLTETYHDQIVSRLAVGPSEYELDRSAGE